MPRYKITIEYDGTSFFGWQRQVEDISIQEEIEKAVYALSQQECRVHGAGRTDTGVHALGQVAHFDCDKEFTSFTMIEGLNAHLRPQPISIIKAEIVSEEFHARFSAINKIYRYRIINRRPQLALDKNRAWHIPQKLDIAAMKKASEYLIGTHDFSCFRSSNCVAKSPIKSIDQIDFIEQGEILDVIFQGRSFMHHQVRNMMGTLIKIGKGKWAPEKIQFLIEKKDRNLAGPTAPAAGLYLEKIDYKSINDR